ncbi:MAG: DUF1016 domain-containing protein [Scytonema sp. CRU_2_7]|nr:DUF1016 domain-containing protein [Scytonema sp. CRU_2_7]
MANELPVAQGYEEFLGELKERIRQAQVRAALAVNRELILLYWQIGRDILMRQQQQGWGAKVIDRLAADLRKAFPDMKGFLSRNLKYMRAFAEAYPDEQFVQQPAAQITWYHNIALMENSSHQRSQCVAEPVLQSLFPSRLFWRWGSPDGATWRGAE